MLEARSTEWRVAGTKFVGGCVDSWLFACFSADLRLQAQAVGAVLPILTSFFGRRLRANHADLEDLAQETLVAAHQCQASYDPGRPFLAWLFGIARHKLADHHRRARAYVPLDQIGEQEARVEGFETALNARIDVDRLLGELPIKQSRSIRETWIFGRTAAEAGARWGIGETDVRVSSHRGLRKLEADLAARKTL